MMIFITLLIIGFLAIELLNNNQNEFNQEAELIKIPVRINENDR